MISGLALIVAIVPAWTAVVTVRDSNKSRDLSTIETIRASVRETAIDLFEKLQNPESTNVQHDFYATQFLDVIEHACYIYNNKMIGEASSKFMKDYLNEEVNYINNSWMKQSIIAKKLNDPVYSDLRKFAEANGINLYST